MTCEEPFWTNCSFDFDNSQRSKMVESPAAAANAFAQQAAATREGDASGVWGQIIDRLQALINALGMSYDTDTAMGEKASMVRAHARMRAFSSRFSPWKPTPARTAPMIMSLSARLRVSAASTSMPPTARIGALKLFTSAAQSKPCANMAHVV